MPRSLTLSLTTLFLMTSSLTTRMLTTHSLTRQTPLPRRLIPWLPPAQEESDDAHADDALADDALPDPLADDALPTSEDAPAAKLRSSLRTLSAGAGHAKLYTPRTLQ
ncbi:hypothetical protein T484DRAFT_1767873 [Baffinella frigidus]|nr:hypothetical protein T484DRAFT_1767873 [Cryptophyta sp. CCMP2293]